MGQSLSEPRTEKDTKFIENDQFLAATSSMQGWRTEMEDAYCIELSLREDKNSAYFAVFDGHGGPNFAAYCSRHLHDEIVADENFKQGNIGCAIKGGFLTLDRKLQEDPKQCELGGTTAIAVLIKENTIYCGNIGDSRAVASVGGVVQELSSDHKPYNPDEESRIYRAGGWVECNRVNGNLALSRAFGDFNFKKRPDLSQEEQVVTANPEIKQFDITPSHEFIVLACDGIWDVMSNKEVVDFVRHKISENMKPDKICESILDHCLAPDCRLGGVGCDNMTVIIVCFLHGRGYSDLVVRCAAPVKPATPIVTHQPSGSISWQRKNPPPSPLGATNLDKFESTNGIGDCSPTAPDPDITPSSPVDSANLDKFEPTNRIENCSSPKDIPDPDIDLKESAV